MTAKWTPPVGRAWMDRYVAGCSVKQLASELGVGRKALTAALREHGIEVRSLTVANGLAARSRSPEAQARTTVASIGKLWGKPQTWDHRCRIARTREAKGIGKGPLEDALGALLLERGLSTVPQKAIGPYNVDIAFDRTAVEVFGGHWHAYGRHKRRTPERYGFLFQQGWRVIVVWVNTERFPLEAAAADAIASAPESMRSLVLWGDGRIAAENVGPETIAQVPSRGR